MNQRIFLPDCQQRELLRESGKVLDDPLTHKALQSINISRLNISWKLKIVTLIYKKKYLRPAMLLLKKVKRMKHILFINGHLNAGGVERSLADILKHMDYTKYAVDLLLLEDVGDYASELPPEVHVLFRDIHNTYGSFVSSIRAGVLQHMIGCVCACVLCFCGIRFSAHAP